MHSSTAQYEEDIVPPVPAIPKAYESPKETDQQFFTNQLRSSQSGFLGKGESATSDFDSNQATKSQRQDIEARRKQSGDSTRAHQRVNTIDDIERSANLSTAQRASRQQLQQQIQQQQDNGGRKNANLQPLRLPPLNLMPMNAPAKDRNAGYARQSQDLTFEDSFNMSQTPEPKRIAKTPSTPMTASKATFFRRQDDDVAKQKTMRSSTSHFALRDLMQLDLDSSKTQFFDDSDVDFTASGVPIPPSKQRNAITPFSSGSLPKRSSEFVRAHRSRPSGDYTTGDFTLGKFQNYQVQDPLPQAPTGTRPSRSGTDASYKTAETPSSFEKASPTVETASVDSKKEKENSSGGLRRKLSLGWRRSSSKGNNDLKSTPPDGPLPEKEKTKLQKRQSEMPPPKLPASATWTGELPSIPRPSLDSIRRKSGPTPAHAIAGGSTANLHDIPALPKTKSQHSEQPQPISAANRSTSWSSNNPSSRAASSAKSASTAPTRKPSGPPALSAIVKDKDDLAADDEMRRLSQKRRDVDTAARESEDLKKRAVARSPMSPDRVLHDRNCTLNIFERGEIMDFEKEGIYFTGTKNARKIVGSLSPPPGDKEKSGNYGYDDERGDYNIVAGDHLAYRYEVVDVLGKGSFGQVVRCVDHKEGGIVAIKIIRNKKRFHQQALVEVSILGRLREWVSTSGTMRVQHID